MVLLHSLEHVAPCYAIRTSKFHVTLLNLRNAYAALRNLVVYRLILRVHTYKKQIKVVITLD